MDDRAVVAAQLGREPRAFLIDDDGRLIPFHDRDDRVGRAEVDSNDFA